MTISRGEVGPHFDEHEMATGDRVQQPGTLIRSVETVPSHAEHDRKAWQSMSVSDRAADKFSMHAIVVPDLNVYQLLPTDPHRKIARIQAFAVGAGGGVGILIGDQASLMNFAPAKATTLALALASASNCWVVSTAVAEPITEYTAKQALYYCALTTNDTGKTMVQCMVERFDSGTPVT